MLYVSVQENNFNLENELNRLPKKGVGAQVTFTGLVRQNKTGDLTALEIEHYPLMTEQSLKEMGNEAIQRFQLSAVLIIHRIGILQLEEQIMAVATHAPHRMAAFEGANFLMDYLKSRAPFWKKEHSLKSATWVDALERDETALKRWT